MDIQKLMQREAPNDNLHDRGYRMALLQAYTNYKWMPLKTLIACQKTARTAYAESNASHQMTAACVVLNELVEYKKQQEGKI